MMRNLKFIIINTIAILLIIEISGCNNKNNDLDNSMDLAEKAMTTAPDSSLSLLKRIDISNLNGKKMKARYALLMSMALDKNYVDTTAFDVLQPAIDYYLQHGTPDEQLLTLYYQGRIYQNNGDFDMAMQSFLKGEDLKGSITDSLTFANMLVAQGNLYARSYQISEYIDRNLNASSIYNKIGKHRRYIASLIRALNGSIINNDKHLSDSIFYIIKHLDITDPKSDKQLKLLRLSYGIKFNSDNDIKEMLDSIHDHTVLDDENLISMGLGYLKLRQPNKAHIIFRLINPNSEIASSARYKYVKSRILEAIGDYKEAYIALNSYINENEAEKSKIYSHKTHIAQKRHDTELENIYTNHKKDKILLLCVFVAVICLLFAVIIYYFFYIGKLKRTFAENERSRLILENENLNMKICQLEEERENLKILADNDKLSSQIKDIVKKRLEILNGILASSISKNNTYSKPYEIWFKQISKDKEEFMNNNRIAFEATHPKFIQTLRNHDLTEDEINYVCLFALGMKGKDAGNYVGDSRHYHKSSAIRKKFGLGERESNLDIYIRNMLKEK